MAHIKSGGRGVQRPHVKTSGLEKCGETIEQGSSKGHGHDASHRCGLDRERSELEQKDALTILSRLLGGDWSPTDDGADEDLRSVPGTFRRALTRALHPVLGKERNKKVSMARQLELDGRHLLSWAAALNARESAIQAEGLGVLLPAKKKRSTAPVASESS